MKNKVCDGKTINYTNATGATIVAGAPVLLGTILGVAVVDIPAGETGVLDIEGVFELPQASVAFDKGGKVYFISGSKLVTNVATDNSLVGFAFAGSSSGDATVEVKINA